MAIRKVCDIVGLVDKTRSVDEATPESMVFVKNCKGCQISFPMKCTKVIIESCSNCTILLQASIRTNTVEVIKCNALVVNSLVPLYTLTADLSTSIKFEFKQQDHFSMLITTKSDDISLKICNIQHQIERDKDSDTIDLDQYISRWNNKKIITELIVREGEGMITTEREKTQAREHAQQYAAAFEAFVRSCVTIAPPPGATAEEGKIEKRVGKLGARKSPEVLKELEEKAKEFLDDAALIDSKSKKLAEIIKNAKHLTVFTGAGISTSAGIPDYRGPQGRWTMEEMGKTQRDEGFTITPMTSAIPTFTHMALVTLQNSGKLKYVISQNCDGLHRKSGILTENISELHGNANLEYCQICGTQYLRDFDASTVSLTTHKTGRKCDVEGCNGDLVDTIINFGENLNQEIVQRAREHTDKADVMIVLGSSCTVSPANTLPLKVAKAHNTLVIVNRQPTPLDKYASLCIGAACDDVFKIVFNELNLTAPQFLIHRHVIIDYKKLDNNSTAITIRGVDERGIRNSFIKGAVVTLPVLKQEPSRDTPANVHNSNECAATVASPTPIPPAPIAPKAPAPPAPKAPATVVTTAVKAVNTRKLILTHEPFVFDVPNDDLNKVHIKLRFMGHYAEPQIELDLNKKEVNNTQNIFLTYDPTTRNWECKDMKILQVKD